MHVESFPVSILRNSVKVGCDPPTGIRPNLLLILNSILPELWGMSKSSTLGKLLFSISAFQAGIQERCRFGSLGFNKKYEWKTTKNL
jgi:dynein heavy chain